MFDSGITAKELIADIQSEADIAIPVSNKLYASWLNSLQQLLYSEVIKEQKLFTYKPNGSSEPIIELNNIDTDVSEDNIRFEDLYTVYADELQLTKTNLESGKIFKGTYYKENNNLVFNCLGLPGEVKINYFVRPALISVNESDVISDGNVMIPVEFIDLAKAKLRGEAYKLANEDNLAAKWLNDYNILLETFKMWISEKSAQFGM